MAAEHQHPPPRLRPPRPRAGAPAGGAPGPRPASGPRVPGHVDGGARALRERPGRPPLRRVGARRPRPGHPRLERPSEEAGDPPLPP
eukprot:7463554-Pyramimonas_sp.AAC.1